MAHVTLATSAAADGPEAAGTASRVLAECWGTVAVNSPGGHVFTGGGVGVGGGGMWALSAGLLSGVLHRVCVHDRCCVLCLGFASTGSSSCLAIPKPGRFTGATVTQIPIRPPDSLTSRGAHASVLFKMVSEWVASFGSLWRALRSCVHAGPAPASHGRGVCMCYVENAQGKELPPLPSQPCSWQPGKMNFKYRCPSRWVKGFHYRNNEGRYLIKVVCQSVLFGSCVCAGSSSTLAYCHTRKLDTRKLIAIEYHCDVYFPCNCMENVRGRFSQSEIQRMNEASSSHSALYLRNHN